MYTEQNVRNAIPRDLGLHFYPIFFSLNDEFKVADFTLYSNVTYHLTPYCLSAVATANDIALT